MRSNEDYNYVYNTVRNNYIKPIKYKYLKTLTNVFLQEKWKHILFCFAKQMKASGEILL